MKYPTRVCARVCVCVIAKQMVERVIRRVQPQVVMVEVDAHRLGLLPPGEASEVFHMLLDSMPFWRRDMLLSFSRLLKADILILFKMTRILPHHCSSSGREILFATRFYVRPFFFRLYLKSVSLWARAPPSFGFTSSDRFRVDVVSGGRWSVLVESTA